MAYPAQDSDYECSFCREPWHGDDEDEERCAVCGALQQQLVDLIEERPRSPSPRVSNSSGTQMQGAASLTITGRKKRHMLFPDPFETLFRFQQALDTYRQSDWLERSPSGSGAYPPVNVFRKGDDFVILAEIPGLKKSELDIQVKDSSIRVSGTKLVSYGDKASLHRRERSAGQFSRAFTIPVRIDADRVKAEYRDGILALYLPRAEQDKPRSIKIG